MVKYGEGVLPPPKVRYSVNEAAAILGVHPHTVWRRLDAGELTRIRDGGRVFIDHAELYRFARTGTGPR